jgi:lauroyl/myristoyl acyltransferase
MSFLDDLSLLSKLATLTVVVWAMPPQNWRRIAEFGITHGEEAFRPFYRRALGISDDESLTTLCAARRISLRESKIQVIGLAGPWRRWRPEIRMHGEEHLKAALERGHGAILWAGNFLYSDLVYKIALHEKGYRATQLYRPAHGFGPSKIGVQLLNPLWMRVEERFLKERVVICGKDTATAVQVLRTRLAENGFVVIFVGNEGRHTTEAPFLNHLIRLATGPVAIAHSTGAALIPLFAVREADGTYDVILEEPLGVPRAANDRKKKFDEVAAAMAGRIEPYARRYPEQWRGWNELIAVGGPDELPLGGVAQEGQEGVAELAAWRDKVRQRPRRARRSA